MMAHDEGWDRLGDMIASVRELNSMVGLPLEVHVHPNVVSEVKAAVERQQIEGVVVIPDDSIVVTVHDDGTKSSDLLFYSTVETVA